MSTLFELEVLEKYVEILLKQRGQKAHCNIKQRVITPDNVDETIDVYITCAGFAESADSEKFIGMCVGLIGPIPTAEAGKKHNFGKLVVKTGFGDKYEIGIDVCTQACTLALAKKPEETDKLVRDSLRKL
jgi:hypothetical protein